MNRAARVNDIMTPEELAACRAYFIISSNNVSDGMVEPACFRIWLRLMMRMLEHERSDSEKMTQVSLSPTRPSTATVSITTPTACPESPRSPMLTLPSIASSTEAPTVETARVSAYVASGPTSSTVPNTPTEPSTTESATKTPAPNSSATVALIHPNETSTKPQNAVLPPAKATTGASSPTSECTSTGKPSAVAPSQPNAGNRPPPVVTQQAPAPTIIQTTNGSVPMPKPTTSPSTAGNGSSAATAQETTTGSTVNNVALQPAPTKMTVQTAARPIPSLVPAVPVFGRSSMVAPTIEHPGRTTATSMVLHPAGPPAVSQYPSVKASTAITPSVPGQPGNAMSSAPEPTPKASRSEYSAMPGLPPSTQATLASRVYAQHHGYLLSSNSSSQPACQTPTASQNGKDNIDPPTGTSNKRQHDDANGQSHHLDHYDDKKYRSRSTSSHGSNGRNQGGPREYQSGRGQSTRPKRRKHRRDRYGDYYGGFDDYW